MGAFNIKGAKKNVQPPPQHRALLQSQIVPVAGSTKRHLFLMNLNLTVKDISTFVSEVLLQSLEDQIIKLTLSHNNLDRLPPCITSLTALESLDLNANSVSTFSPVFKMTSLTELDVCNNKIHSISDWPTLPSLTSLRIGINPIQPLNQFDPSRFPSLKKLFIFELPMTSLKSLPQFDLLTNLDLDNCKLPNFVGFPKLDNLIWLLARSNGLQTLQGLPHLPALRYLFLNENHIQNIDELQGCPSLEWLLLPGNKLTKIPPFKWRNLTDLSLDNNSGITDFRPLDDLPKLSKLSVLNMPEGLAYKANRFKTTD